MRKLIQLVKINTIAQVDRETLVAFDQHVPIEDHTDKWEKNLIESHLLYLIYSIIRTMCPIIFV